MIRIAMIGAGAMAGAVHYPSLASFDDVDIAAVCDLDPERPTTTADRYCVTARYRDFGRAPAPGSPIIAQEISSSC